MALSVLRFGQLVGAATVSGMAEKLGIPARPLSVRDMISRFGLPLQPTHLRFSWPNSAPVDHPPDSKNVPVTTASFEWDDPGGGSLRAASAWTFHLDQPDQPNFHGEQRVTGRPILGLNFDFDTEYMWHIVPENEFGQGPSSPDFAFASVRRPSPPQPTPQPRPIPQPPPNLIGISKLSLFNCQIERHTVHVWVRDITGRGPWSQIQVIESQYNSNDQCPYDDNGILADSSAILTKSGEDGGFKCTSGNIYQVSIVDPDRPTCEGRNDPDVGNCVVEDQPSFFKFHNDGNELIVMLEDGRLAPFPNP